MRAAAIVAGVVAMAFAGRGIVADAGATSPPDLARWMVGLLAAHDLVLAPVLALGAAVLWRRAPRWWGGPVTAAVALTGLLVGFSLPLVLGLGLRPDTPSALPRAYGTNLTVVVGLVWAVAAAVVAVRAGRRRRRLS